jgi:hypothetical protein
LVLTNQYDRKNDRFYKPFADAELTKAESRHVKNALKSALFESMPESRPIVA